MMAVRRPAVRQTERTKKQKINRRQTAAASVKTSHTNNKGSPTANPSVRTLPLYFNPYLLRSSAYTICTTALQRPPTLYVRSTHYLPAAACTLSYSAMAKDPHHKAGREGIQS